MSVNELPNDVESLKKIILSQNEEIKGYIDLVAQLRRKQYGPSSEKVSSEQLGIFDEVESEALNPEPEDEESITVSEHKRKRGKRLKLPPNLPRVDVIIDIENKICPQDGEELKCIGEEISEKLEIIPAKVRVIRTIKRKYFCQSARRLPWHRPHLNYFQSPMPQLRFSPTSPSPNTSMLFLSTDRRRSLKESDLISHVRRCHYLHMDETVVQVLKEDGKKAETNSYMWVQATSGPKPIIIYHYAKNRSGSNAEELLEGYHGALQVDGYDGYAATIKNNQILRLGCWAHARRKFFDAFKSSSGKGIGKQGLAFFKKIYNIEEEIKESSAEARFIARLTRSIPIVKELDEWIKEQSQKVNPESLGGKALKYTKNGWDYLMNCFNDGEYRIDNNYIESHIRPFTIGRKNWMFSVKPEGATASANIYSLVETAKGNGLDPFDYLNMVFAKLPGAETEQDFLELLPVKI